MKVNGDNIIILVKVLIYPDVKIILWKNRSIASKYNQITAILVVCAEKMTVLGFWQGLLHRYRDAFSQQDGLLVQDQRQIVC